ncbi:MAG: ABC transporter permease [Candidatus Korobacteraceae bacterium]
MHWRRFFRRDEWDEERARELEAYLEIETDENIARGMSPEEARYAAQRKLGNTARIREEIYRMNSLRFLDTLFCDVRYALRMLRKNPSFTAIALLTLAVGIGANTAIFSVVNAVLLRPFPYPHPERLVSLSERAPGLPLMYIAMANLDDWRAMNTVFENIEGFRSTDVTLTGHGDPQRLAVRQVSPGFFPMLGLQPILGRPFTPQDDKPEAKPVVLLSDSLWTREFGRDHGILHRSLILDGVPYTVIGIVPSSRCHMTWRQTDAFTPLGRMRNVIGGPEHRDAHSGIWAYARLKPGVTLEQARADMAAVARRLEKQYPQTNLGQGVNVDPLLQNLVKNARQPLTLLMGAVGLVLLIACANVANLLMSLSVVRRREIAVRSALGAGEARLARQHLCESLLLALLGGALGLVVAYCATAALGHLASSSLPRLEDVAIDRSVLLFTFGVSLLTGTAFGVFPALMALRIDPNEVFKDASHGSRSGLTRMGFRSFLGAGELALSLALLVATGLTIKSLFHLLQADLGFQPQGVLTAAVSLPPAKYANSVQRGQFIESLVERIARLPGVKAAGFGDPLLGGSQTDISIEGRPQPPVGSEPYVELSRITPGTLEALSIKFSRGRDFNSRDDASAPPVCIIDDSLAEQQWPGEDALGKRLSFDLPSTVGTPYSWWTIVGVVHHVQLYGASKPALPQAYLSHQQVARSEGTLAILSEHDRSLLEPMIREVLYSLDPDLPLYDVLPLAEYTDAYVAPQKLSTVLLSILAGIALLLAALGTYGVMAYMVAGRTPEIGVRRALGATPADVLRLVMSQGVCLSLGGLLAGILLSLALGRILTPMLFGVKASDPMTFASVGGLLMAVALAACYIPAQRAVRLDPIEAVRHE